MRSVLFRFLISYFFFVFIFNELFTMIGGKAWWKIGKKKRHNFLKSRSLFGVYPIAKGYALLNWKFTIGIAKYVLRLLTRLLVRLSHMYTYMLLIGLSRSWKYVQEEKFWNLEISIIVPFLFKQNSLPISSFLSFHPSVRGLFGVSNRRKIWMETGHLCYFVMFPRKERKKRVIHRNIWTP